MIEKYTPLELLALRERVRAVLKKASANMKRKRAAGICVWVDCDRPAAGIPRDVLFFGDDHCAEHARQAEIECLEDEQTDDEAGRLL